MSKQIALDKIILKIMNKASKELDDLSAHMRGDAVSANLALKKAIAHYEAIIINEGHALVDHAMMANEMAGSDE